MSAPPDAPSSPGAAGADLLSRIPTFPPAPPAEKITLPVGPAAAWLTHIPTSQKVAFLTIDDGWVKQPEAIQLVQAAHVPVTLFLTIDAIRNNPGYFKRLEAGGAVIEAHTLTHPELKGKPLAFQQHEICGSADQLGALYGRRPVLFRPPFGDKDLTTLLVTHQCGMKAAFFWKETVDKGVVHFQEGHTVQPGDIILMHFRPAFAADFLAALQAIHDAGLTPALLENYIP
ncbi:polysaccharide deacetylase family protein [Planosporangium thailandense]|uniref:polysaccharide deacetylase family protein n=1 Tax=Planosporangium thailandense TaxID=765197 RepID=UPI0030B80684